MRLPAYPRGVGDPTKSASSNFPDAAYSSATTDLPADLTLLEHTIAADFITSVLQLEKRCIFCGKRPSDKNKEHVIPQWLSGHVTRESRKLVRLMIKFNGCAINQVKADGARISFS